MSEIPEIELIRKRYKKRQIKNKDSTPDLVLPHRYMSHQEKERAFLRLLSNWSQDVLFSLKVLEVGCGYGDNILQLLRWGINAENILGNELMSDRCAIAKSRLPSQVKIDHGDALAMSVDSESIDILIQSTVFTSILDNEFQNSLASHMWGLVKPGGGIIWYDFRFNNPYNSDVRGVKYKRIRELFPEARILCKRITLAPPIARRVCDVSPALYHLFNLLPVLRSHLFCWIEKPK